MPIAMRPISFIVAAVSAGGLFFATGCNSPGRSQPGKASSYFSASTNAPTVKSRQRSSTKSRKPAPVTDPTQIDDDELERRVRAHAAFAAGIVSVLNDDPDSGLAYFEKAVMTDPTKEDLAIDVARRRLQRNEFEKAVEILKRAAAVPGASGTVLAYLGLTLKQLERTGEAIDAYREALRRMPGNLASAGALAELLSEDKRSEEAFQILKSLSTQPSEDPRYWIDLSDLLQPMSGRLPARAEEIRALAATLFQRAYKLETSDPRVLRRLADQSFEAKRMEEAEALYKRLQEAGPRDPFPSARLAEIYLRTGRAKEAASQLQSLQRQSPTDPLPVYYLGLLALDERQPDRAVEMFSRALLLGPDFEPPYLDLAATLLAMDRAADALAVLEKRLARFKSVFRAEFISAMASARLEKADDAERHFLAAEERARAEQPHLLDHRFYFQFGATMERLGKIEIATRQLLLALEKKPDFDEALNHLGYMWADRGENLERAHEMIRKAVEAEPENAAYLDSLGWVLFKLNRPAEALPWLEKSLKLLEKPDATILEHLGDVCAALKRWKDAGDYYRKALSLESEAAGDAVKKKLDALPQ